MYVRREEFREAFVPAEKGDMNYRRADYDDESIGWELLTNGVDHELVVKSSEVPVIFASDSVYWYRNWEESRIPGIRFSVEAWMGSVARMKAIHGVTLIPGHEPTIDMSRIYGRKGISLDVYGVTRSGHGY